MRFVFCVIYHFVLVFEDEVKQVRLSQIPGESKKAREDTRLLIKVVLLWKDLAVYWAAGY